MAIPIIYKVNKRINNDYLILCEKRWNPKLEQLRIFSPSFDLTINNHVERLTLSSYLWIS